MKPLLVAFWLGCLVGMAFTLIVQERYSFSLTIREQVEQPLPAGGVGSTGGLRMDRAKSRVRESRKVAPSRSAPAGNALTPSGGNLLSESQR